MDEKRKQKIINLAEYRKKRNRRLKGEIAVADEYNTEIFKTHGIKPKKQSNEIL